MDRQEPQPEKRESRPGTKSDTRQTDMDARYQEGVSWRNTVRTDDVEWRQTTRKEDREWRQMTRSEDLEWREGMRREDREWRAEVRDEDRQHRLRSERVTKRCHALAAAAYASKPGSSPKDILALAQQFENWLSSDD
jgi:hypothetical protein